MHINPETAGPLRGPAARWPNKNKAVFYIKKIILSTIMEPPHPTLSRKERDFM